jgi:sulfur carrier protein
MFWAFLKLNCTLYFRMEIKLNNVLKELPENCSVQQLVDLTMPQSQNGIAVAVNQQVISKNNWQEFLLNTNDDVLIIKATQGG